MKNFVEFVKEKLGDGDPLIVATSIVTLFTSVVLLLWFAFLFPYLLPIIPIVAIGLSYLYYRSSTK